MTGTPIQNNLMELWSLTNWLEFGMYAGKQNMKHFKRQIEKPCKNGDPRGFERLQVEHTETVLQQLVTKVMVRGVANCNYWSFPYKPGLSSPDRLRVFPVWTRRKTSAGAGGGHLPEAAEDRQEA